MDLLIPFVVYWAWSFGVLLGLMLMSPSKMTPLDVAKALLTAGISLPLTLLSYKILIQNKKDGTDSNR